ncbi:uncharacterized protein CIMG_13407 [Coccidioides immitis RS]|uniref:Uncharacterized protein n=2 Tax=Coccidioides immitis TaxID=5501 RepID=A0A0D8JVV5_COCIM|nr:uncharacterized protein CIMG_13407 [Coccidioides immitis RS]KJF61076.1 hypothetical protein CIMG_13407 [Coccidioides immitis RS]KMU85597.1 hypothetical protein CIHG_03638 [Coccidioides immitis H538.4]
MSQKQGERRMENEEGKTIGAAFIAQRKTEEWLAFEENQKAKGPVQEAARPQRSHVIEGSMDRESRRWELGSLPLGQDDSDYRYRSSMDGNRMQMDGLELRERTGSPEDGGGGARSAR